MLVQCRGVPAFQSTYPHGVRPALVTPACTFAAFQSTYPHGVRRPCPDGARLLQYFNPRTRTGYDLLRPQRWGWRSISIHVPARGTTYASFYSQSVPSFQSTYPHGYDESRCNGLHISIFQSTYPHGVRHLATPVVRAIHIISIHVPARGTTRWARTRCFSVPHFNPRTRTGYDEACLKAVT